MKPSFGLGLLGFAGMYVNAEIAADVQQIITNLTVDGILSTLETNLDKFLTAVRRGRERLHERSQETVVAGVGSSNSDERAAAY